MKKIDGGKIKAKTKNIGSRIKRVGGWVLRKLWNARQYIVAIFIGMFALFAKGYSSGYSQRRDEEEETLDERMKLLDKLAGADTEEADQIQEAKDLVEEYGLETLQKAAAAIEEGDLEEDE